jgi:two-component system NtrC family sensor kinase
LTRLRAAKTPDRSGRCAGGRRPSVWKRPEDSRLHSLTAAFLDEAEDAVAAFRPGSGEIFHANRAFAELTGVALDQLEGRDFFFCLGKAAAKEVRAAVEALLGGETPRTSLRVELEIPLHPPLCVDASLVLMRPTPKRPVVWVLLRDVTAWSEQTKKLQRQVEFLRSVVDGSLQGFVATDIKGRILLFNRGARLLLGYEEAEVVGSKFIQELYDGSAAREVMELLRGPSHGGAGVLDRYHTILVAKSRERIPVWMTVHLLRDERGREQGTVSAIHDMRDVIEMERRLEEVQMQLIHADKMVSLGKLAAGVAHEINNPLGGILLFGGLLLEDMDFSDPRRGDMDRIVQEARRCKEIVHSLLDFAHQQRRYREPVDLNAAVDQCLSLLGNKALFQNVEVRRETSGALPLVTGNPSQIKQVFTNIVTNAVDAMNGEGVLTVCSWYDTRAKEVIVSFTDTGPGIPPDIRTQIFEPFFTTKGPGKGTGLGLSLSYNIVRVHRGDIRVDSSPGEGATISVALPPAEEEAE